MFKSISLNKFTNNYFKRNPLLQLTTYTQRSMKIYTKTGDKGTSALYTGDRFGKDEHIFECLGAIDEVNAYLGLVRELRYLIALSTYIG